MDVSLINRRERFMNITIMALICIGWGVIIYSTLHLEDFTGDIWTLVLLSAFLLWTELYPIPVWKGITSFSFPLIYTIVLLYGIWYGLIILTSISLVVNLIKKRKQQIVWFNPAQLAIALIAAYLSTNQLLIVTGWTDSTVVGFYYVHLCLFTFVFYLMNNLLIDFVLWLRPQKYAWKDWKQKTIQETIIVLISICYLAVMFALGNQNRGVVDVFSYLFFFSPLVAASVLSAVISKQHREKQRLKALVQLTKELNRTLPSAKWAVSLDERLDEFIQTDATLFIMKDVEENWNVILQNGGVIKGIEKVFTGEWIQLADESIRYASRKQIPDDLATYLYKSIRSVIITPLRVEEDTVGILLVGSEQNQIYQTTDIQFLSTLANQLAVIIKTKMLFSEREKRILLEERNRIAREIHDGIAQTLAGAVMNLESSKRVSEQHEKTSLVNESIDKLRGSLSEVRESIYALRPSPTEKFGVEEAVKAKCEDILKAYSIPVMVKIVGARKDLSPHIEQNVYEIVSEALQNAAKHSNASNVFVTFRYCKGNLVVRVKDNGRGFRLYEALLKANIDAHYGILNMNELAEQIDASFKINSSERYGTVILMIVPLSK
ncbi:GAF domain-containing sensor histidine kinase [Pseudalkalibacillus berkeleyi]|uniref:histidine kinase n=1 Tax=Pseudalkalibacillus berkeleyi TaxID=1069813 RepID=A0ABS9GYJ6_9BACL|nr:GAF domain-containing sensor histidine kinase [Pseudalkalibacillus berkeleyi]MCF6136746.1 GAF domain-containing sensor histidine kinase [Pseudalkalibacillus berkeleyi]